jgi:hypothetical protein
MKEVIKGMRLIFVLFFMLLIACKLHAKDKWVDIDSATYILIDDKDRSIRYQATLREWKSSAMFVAVPDEVVYKGKTYKVTSIFKAFHDLPNLEEVYIGNNVTEVWGGSFVNCPNLKRILSDNRPPVSGSIINCPSFDGIYLGNSNKSYKKIHTLSNVKAKSVRVENLQSYQHLFSTKGCDIDTLYITTNEKLHFNPNPHSRIGTVIVESMPNERWARSAQDCVIQTTVENLIIGNGVEYLPYRFITSNTLKTIKESGSVQTAVDGCFGGMTGLKEINSDNNIIKAEIYYAQAMEDTWSIIGGKSKDLLKKASELGCPAATKELALYSSNDAETIELIKKSIEQGNNTPDAKEHLLFFDQCKDLHNLYLDVQSRIKNNKIDSSSVSKFYVLSSKVISNINGNELKYYTTEYKNLRKEIDYMLHYFCLYDAINTKPKSSYFRETVYRLDDQAIIRDAAFYTSGLSACDNAAKSNFDANYKNFFASSRKRIEELYNQFRNVVDKEREAYDKYMEKMRKQREEEHQRYLAEREAQRERNNIRKVDMPNLEPFGSLKDSFTERDIYKRFEKGFTAEEQDIMWRAAKEGNGKLLLDIKW